MASVSSQLKSRLQESGSLLSALDAISNLRAFAVLAVTFIVFAATAAVLFGISASIATKSMGFGAFAAVISGLICYAIAIVGCNATGILLMDEAAGRTPRGAVDALLASLFTSHRFVLVLLIEFFLYLIYLMLLAIVIYVCKIPGVGPVLYAFVFPLGVILSGVIFFALVYVALPLAAPAVWNGSTVTQIIAMLGLVARQRLLYVVIMEILLGLLMSLVAGFIAFVFISGVATMMGLSGVIIGIDSVGYDLLALVQSLVSGGGSGSGYAWAVGFGALVVFLCGAIPPVLVALKGMAIIYLDATSGLSIADAEAQMQGAVDGLKAKANEARERAVAPHAASQHGYSASSAPPAPLQSSPAAAHACPACHVAISPADVFCGNCGHKLT